MKIGILGGSFDPPHVGHLLIAEWVKTEFGLDRVMFVPAFAPPHKRLVTPFAARCQMVELAVQGNPGFQISKIESTIRGPTYTIETLRRLHQTLRAELALIIGADQLNDIPKWKDPTALIRRWRVIVIPRPGYETSEFWLPAGRIVFSKSPAIGLSSSLIRQRVARGMDIRYLVPDAVRHYIRQHRLYAGTQVSGTRKRNRGGKPPRRAVR